MVDYMKLGMMKAEFEAACRAIDVRAAAAGRDCLKETWQALLAGNLHERDRVVTRHNRIEPTVTKAKTEAWLRLGEKHGISREDALASLKKIYQ